MKNLKVTSTQANGALATNALNVYVVTDPIMHEELERFHDYGMTIIMECRDASDGIRDRRYTQTIFSPLAYKVMYENLKELMENETYQINLQEQLNHLREKENDRASH